MTSKFVIAKIYRDLRLNDPNYELDFIEWFGEALAYIGTSVQLLKKETKITATDYKAGLPPDLVILTQLLYNSPQHGWIYLRYNPSSFNNHESSANFNASTEESYSLNPNYIVTSFESGEIDISYKALPLDEEGYPLIPDNVYFKEALFWYCVKQMILGGYVPKVAQLTYEFADNKWKFYCTAARNKANYPDIGQYQRFAETWVGLIPNTRLFDNGFDLNKDGQIPHEIITASNLIT